MRRICHVLPVLGSLACGGDSGDSGGKGERACNGDPGLCDRPLDEAVFAGTHNSMSNADDGWQIPNQQHGIGRQLADGVRAMLLDTYEWEGGLWLCHGYCELGAIPMTEALGYMRDFLDREPDNVLILILQDGITPAQNDQAFEEAGLGGERIALPLPSPAPTLGELIDARTRLLVVLESGAQEATGAWEVFYDTPYAFDSVAALSAEGNCDLNRGDPANPLFLINHWAEDPFPDPALSAEANTAEALGARVEGCRAAWGRLPTVIAVDHYAEGGLSEVVAALNAG